MSSLRLRYTEGFSLSSKRKPLPSWRLPLSFHYLTTGKETLFACRLDPDYAPRAVFSFHRPETLIEIAKSGETMRQKIRQLPPLIEAGLRDNQVAAIKGLEKSFATNHLRSPTPQTMGSGKTMLSCAQAFRLLRYGGAKLFLVDRINLGEQALREFRNYVTPDDGRKLGELYNIQLLRSNQIDRAANVVITLSHYWAQVKARAGLEFDFYLASKHYGVSLLYRLDLSKRAIAAQMAWSEKQEDKLLAVYGHIDLIALSEVDALYEAGNVIPLPTAAQTDITASNPALEA